MRKLTPDEETAMLNARQEIMSDSSHDPRREAAFFGFRRGFVAGLEYSAEGLACLRLVQQLAGRQTWREWLEQANDGA